jgi:AbrB family looped-hinge helix DNA binding protein
MQTGEHPMEATVQVRQRGTLTLPAEIREKYGIQPGDTFRLIDIEGTMVLTPMVAMVPELAREIERLRLESGLSIDQLLVSLREQRERYHEERYAADEPFDRAHDEPK